MENKKRLIYAEDLKNLALKLGRSVRLDRYTGRWPCLLLADINEVPTVDAAEVVHGEWVWKDLNGDGSLVLCCSVCLGTDGARETAHYCSECGAKMDGGAKDGT